MRGNTTTVWICRPDLDQCWWLKGDVPGPIVNATAGHAWGWRHYTPSCGWMCYCRPRSTCSIQCTAGSVFHNVLPISQLGASTVKLDLSVNELVKERKRQRKSHVVLLLVPLSLQPMSVWRNHNQCSLVCEVPSALLVCLRIRQKRDPHIPPGHETEAASALKHRKK